MALTFISSPSHPRVSMKCLARHQQSKLLSNSGAASRCLWAPCLHGGLGMVLQGLWGLKPLSVLFGPTGLHPISPLASSCPGLSISSHQSPPQPGPPTRIALQSSASATAYVLSKTIQINHALFFLMCSAFPHMLASARRVGTYQSPLHPQRPACAECTSKPMKPRVAPSPTPNPRLPAGTMVPSSLRFMCIKNLS